MITITDKKRKEIEKYLLYSKKNWGTYYNTKTNAKNKVKDILDLINNKDKNLFLELLHITDRTINIKLLNNIYLFSKYYFKTILQEQNLTEKEVKHFKLVKNRLNKQLKAKKEKKLLLKNKTDNIILHILSNNFKFNVIKQKTKLKSDNELGEKLDKYKNIKSKVASSNNNLMELKLELKNLINKTKKD